MPLSDKPREIFTAEGAESAEKLRAAKSKLRKINAQ
jgi:hypothetical protein